MQDSLCRLQYCKFYTSTNYDFQAVKDCVVHSQYTVHRTNKGLINALLTNCQNFWWFEPVVNTIILQVVTELVTFRKVDTCEESI